MTLKKPKVQGGKRGGKKKQQQAAKPIRGDDTDEDLQNGGSDDDDVRHSARTAMTVFVCSSRWILQLPSKVLASEQEPRSPSAPVAQSVAKEPVPEALGADDPLLTIPLPRYNAMLAVLRNTLYMFVFILFYFLWNRLLMSF